MNTHEAKDQSTQCQIAQCNLGQEPGCCRQKEPGLYPSAYSPSDLGQVLNRSDPPFPCLQTETSAIIVRGKQNDAWKKSPLHCVSTQ